MLKVDRFRMFSAVAAGATAVALGLLGAGPHATAAAAAPPGAPTSRTVQVPKSPASTFALVAGSHVFTGTPATAAVQGKRYVAWATHTGLTFGVSYVTMNETTGTASVVHAALSGLGSVNDHLTVLPQGTVQQVPLLVFTGTSCVQGAVGPTTPWAVQTWSLSNDCFNPVPAAAEADDGTLGASWPGSPGLRYRIGISVTTPATGPDQSITVTGTPVFKTGTAVVPASQHFDVGWAQFGGSADGYYVKDVTAGTAPTKMPGTGPRSITAQPPIGGMAMAAGSDGAYLAACSNTNPCHLLLWRAGATTAHGVPGAKQPYISAVAPGPGLEWVAWGDQANNTVKATRYRPVTHAFEPVTTLHTACAEHEIVSIVGPNASPADIALECVANKTLQPAVYVAHVLPRMRVVVSPSKVSNKSKHTVTVTATDAGLGVPSADVTLRGTTKTTNANGKVTFTVAAGTPAKKYQVVVKKAPFYQVATATLTVTH
jgi:hypothetical protein